MLAPGKLLNQGLKAFATDRRVVDGGGPCAAAALLLSAAVPQLPDAQDRAVTYAPADIRYGAQIYAAQCSACHGANGTQIGGVDLGGGQLRRASSD